VHFARLSQTLKRLLASQDLDWTLQTFYWNSQSPLFDLQELLRGSSIVENSFKKRGKTIEIIKTRRLLVAALLALMVCGAFTAINPSAIFAQAATVPTVVSTELINYYGMTSSEVQTFMTTLQNQGITTLTLRINSYSEYTGNSNTAIAKIKAMIPVANSRGISINVDLHTWYTTWDNNFRDSASNSASNRGTYINYVKQH
jgi:hypothetical protein